MPQTREPAPDDRPKPPTAEQTDQDPRAGEQLDDGQREEGQFDGERPVAAPAGEPLDGRSVRGRRRLLTAVWVVLAVWTVLLSIGTSLYAPAPGAGPSPTVDWRRGGLVFLFVGGFLALWIWLASRKRTPSRFRDGLAVPDHRGDGVQAGQEHDSQQSQEDQ
ncbi:MAG: hypothetical protein ACTHOU_14305 [Aureliella sp.]